MYQLLATTSSIEIGAYEKYFFMNKALKRIKGFKLIAGLYKTGIPKYL